MAGEHGGNDSPKGGQDVDGHVHSHDAGVAWSDVRGEPVVRALLALLGLAALTTLVALVTLWPTGDDVSISADAAAEIGLVPDLVEARVDALADGPCSYAPDDDEQRCRTLTFSVTGGDDAGRTVELPEISLAFEQNVPPVGVGDDVILEYEPTTDTYSYADVERRSSLLLLAAVFAIAVIALGRLRGLLALAALAITVVVLVLFVAPSVLEGNDPLLVAVVGAAAIAFVSLYLTHGFTPTTSVALAATLGALGLTVALSAIFFELANFTGLVSEEAFIVPLLTQEIDLSALLLGGAVIGALGALDDVTVTQVAAVGELHRADEQLSARSLFAAGIRIGRDHIASTVNTLLLAYAGASIPLLLLFASQDQPLDLVANSEVVAVEIVRTLTGSLGLIAAVPLATALAAVVVTRAGSSEEADIETPEAVPTEPAQWEDFAPDGDFWTE